MHVSEFEKKELFAFVQSALETPQTLSKTLELINPILGKTMQFQVKSLRVDPALDQKQVLVRLVSDAGAEYFGSFELDSSKSIRSAQLIFTHQGREFSFSSIDLRSNALIRLSEKTNLRLESGEPPNDVEHIAPGVEEYPPQFRQAVLPGTGMNLMSTEYRTKVLFVYTPMAATSLVGTNNPAALTNVFLQYVAYTNQAFINSGVGHVSIELAGIQELTGVPESTGSPITVKDFITNPANQAFWQAHEAAEEHEADIIAIFSNSPTNGICGVATLGGTVLSMTVRPACSNLGRIFAHELSHNFGNNHDAGHGGGGSTPYAMGDMSHPWNGYVDIMAYYPGTHAQVYAGPESVVSGSVIGSDTANAARQIANAAPIKAAFRSTPRSCGNGVIEFASGERCEVSVPASCSQGISVYSQSVLPPEPGKKCNSSCQCETPAPGSVPGRPGQIRVTERDYPTTISYEFPPADFATQYRVYRRLGTSALNLCQPENFVRSHTHQDGTISFRGKITNLNSNSQYRIGFEAFNANGRSRCSSAIGGTSNPVSIPEPPSGFLASDGDDENWIQLSWIPPRLSTGGTSAARYKVYRSVANGPFTLLYEGSPSFPLTDATHYISTVATVPTEQIDRYAVSAVNAFGESALSNIDFGHSGSIDQYGSELRPPTIFATQHAFPDMLDGFGVLGFAQYRPEAIGVFAQPDQNSRFLQFYRSENPDDRCNPETKVNAGYFFGPSLANKMFIETEAGRTFYYTARQISKTTNVLGPCSVTPVAGMSDGGIP